MKDDGPGIHSPGDGNHTPQRPLEAWPHYERALDAIASALYDEPYTYCEACNGIGSDENVPFWCSACGGEGYVVDEDEVSAHREHAEIEAATALHVLMELQLLSR